LVRYDLREPVPLSGDQYVCQGFVPRARPQSG